MTEAPHSAEYFGEQRDFWWNSDFLRLMGTRWNTSTIASVLDVGCGVGHWGRALLAALPSTARITGVDREPRWVEQATARAHAAGVAERFSYVEGDASRLPFRDASFDMVTCQTVLIHVRDVVAVLREMLRVLVPGGLIAVVEPNNFATAATLDSIGFETPVDEVIARLRFQLICHRGKAALGLGDNSIGELIPGHFARLGLRELQVHLNDKASPSHPPYDTPEQRATTKQSLDWIARDFWIWDRDETRRYFEAGGGDPADFETQWAAVMVANHAVRDAIEGKRLHYGGGSITYLVAGRKPT